MALSGYHCDLLDEIYQDWDYIEAPEKQCLSVKQPRTEVLWINYNVSELALSSVLTVLSTGQKL